jgi:hypothetical protein
MRPLLGTHGKTGRTGWQKEIGRLDKAIHAAVAATPARRLDRFFPNLSRAADHSKLWTGSAAVDGLASHQYWSTYWSSRPPDVRGQIAALSRSPSPGA